MDRAYSNLLAHLHNVTPSLPLTTIQSALAHYLAHLSPLPTPLAASAVSSALYLAQPFTNEKLQSLLTAFRHATHLRYRKQKDDIASRSSLGNLFSRSLNVALGQWMDDVVEGIQGGHPVLRLSSLSGLLLGIHDLELEAKKQADGDHARSINLGSARNNVEDELIVAVAEVMDTYSCVLAPASSGEWEKEFQPTGRDILTLALIIASQSIPLVSQERFNVLPLPALSHILLITLSSTFYNGKFLDDLRTSIVHQDQQTVVIPPDSFVARTLHSISVSPVFTSAASLSRLAARSLRSRLEGYSDSKRSEGLHAASEALQVLLEMAKQIEGDWSTALLARVTERDISPDTRPITQAIWSTLKTILFSTIMLSDAILTSVVYIHPTSTPYTQASTSASEIALHVLEILSHFSFIISQFGGVTSTGFEQLKKTFYLALDILAQENDRAQHNDGLVNSYVRDQCLALKSPAIAGTPSSIRNAKKALVLASIEQLVPILSEDHIREYVFDVCWPHLSDVSHRETFESAHSVILAVFASHAQQQQQRQSESAASHSIHSKPDGQDSWTDNNGLMKQSSESPDFVKKMVPFYAHCLIENSAGGRLSTPQLRMAYAALVRCAGASGLNIDTIPEESLSLSWFCVQLLLDTINPSSQGENGHESSPKDDMTEERLHRLHLTLISTVPSLPLVLMLRALQEIKTIITSILSPPLESISLAPSTSSRGDTKPRKAGTRGELVKALFQEIMEQVGYREKSAAMHWWYENRVDLLSAQAGVPPRTKVDDGAAMTAS